MDDLGRAARSPWRMPWPAWRAVAKRSWDETSSDNIGLIAAGVAFYGFLAIVPLLGAVVLVYGLLADRATVIGDMNAITAIMPSDVARLIGDQLLTVVETSDGKKGLGLLLALALAIFGARNGAGAVITALNVAYEEDEKRGFIHVNLLSIGITFAAVVVAMVALAAVAALGHLGTILPSVPEVAIILGKLALYGMMAIAGAGAAAALYAFGPSRTRASFIWLTPGSLFCAATWLLLTVGFGVYVANVGNYDATYGSLGTVVATLTWLYLSSYILLFGAELNAEFEHQTAKDTTLSRDAPLGERGAWVADHVAGDGTTSGAEPAVGTPSEPEPPPPPAEDSHRADNRQGFASRFGAGRVTNTASRLAGLPKLGWITSATATVGLGLCRQRRMGPGLGLVAAAIGLAWFGGDRRTSGGDRSNDRG